MTIFLRNRLMNGKNMEQDPMKRKLKELQKFTPNIKEMLNSSKNGGKISVSSVKLEKMYEILTGKIKCKPIHLIQIEEFMRRVTLNSSKEQNKPQNSKAAPEEEDCIEVIDLDSSDEDDVVEIVSVTAPQPKNFSSLKDPKQSQCEVPNEQKSPVHLEDDGTVDSNRNKILVENEETEKDGEGTCVTTNKLSALDADNNNISPKCVIELNTQSDKKETLVVTINNSPAQSRAMKKSDKVKKHSKKKHKEKRHKDKKIKNNLKPKVSSTVRKVCDSKFNISVVPSVVIISKNAPKPIGKTLEESRKRAEVSSTTSKSMKRSHKMIELNTSSDLVEETEKARSVSPHRIVSVVKESTKETQDNTVTASGIAATKTKSKFVEDVFESISSDEEKSQEMLSSIRVLPPHYVQNKSLNEDGRNITTAGNDIEAGHADIFEDISDDDIASSKALSIPKGKRYYEKNNKSLDEEDKPNSTNMEAKSDPTSSTSGIYSRKTEKADKNLNIPQSIDLVQNENVDLDIFDKAIDSYTKSDTDRPENKNTHANRGGILSRRKDSNKSGIKRPSEERNTIVTGVSSTCNESVSEVTDGSSKEQLNGSNVIEDSISSLINQNQNSTPSVKENEIVSGHDDKRAGADNGQLWLHDSETEDFIKRLNLACGPDEKKKDNKQQLSKTETKGSISKISNRRPSQKQFSTAKNSPTCISKKDEKQKEPVQLKTPTKSNEASSSSLLNRLFNAGLLRDKRNSSEQIEPISSSQKLSAEKGSSSDQTENAKMSSFEQETPSTSKIKSNNSLKERSIEVELPISPKQTEPKPSPRSKTSEVSIDPPEYLLNEQNSKPMSPKQTEPEPFPLSKTSENLLNPSEKGLTEQIFEFQPAKSVLETSNKLIFPCFSSPQKDISNVNSAHSPQNEEALFERRSEKKRPERQDFKFEDCLKMLNLPKIKSILDDLANSSIGNVTNTTFDETTVITGSQEESATLKVLVDEWASKDLNELHEIRFQLEKDLGVDLGTLLNSGGHGNPVSISTSDTDMTPIPMDITEDIENITYDADHTNKPHQENFPTFSSHYGLMKFFEKPNLPALDNLPQYLGLSSEIKSNDPRLRSRLTLLYAKTTDSRLQQDQVKHHMPTADEVLGSQDERVQKEIKSACIKEISKPNFQKYILRNQPTPSKSLERPVARTYGEYKRMKAALEAEVARKKAVLEAANRAHQLDMEADKEMQKTLQAENERLKASELEQNQLCDEKLKKTVSKAAIKPANRVHQLEMEADKKSHNTLQAEDRLETSELSDDTKVKRATKKRISHESCMEETKPHQKSDTNQEKRAKLGQNDVHNDFNEDVILHTRKRRSLSTSSDSELDTQESPTNPNKRQKLRKRKIRTNFPDTSCKIANSTSTEREAENEKSRPFDETKDKALKNFLNNSNVDKIDPVNLKENLEKIIDKKNSSSLTNNLKGGKLNRETTALYRAIDDMFIRDDVLKINGRRRQSVIVGEKRIKKIFAEENNTNNSQESNSEKEDASKQSEEHFAEENSVENSLQNESTKDTSKSSMGCYSSCTEEDDKMVRPSRRSPTFYSDEDADTDNFEELIARKRQEEEIAKIARKRLINKLKILTPEEEVLRKTKLADAASHPETAPTNQSEGDDVSKSMKVIPFEHGSQSNRPKSMPEIKNINPAWHCKDMLFSKYCLLCCKKFEHLAEHYVISHPHRENFSSRLPASDVKYLEEHPGTITVKRLNKPYNYTAKCFFCGCEMKGRLHKFSQHLASHTGEFPYKCSICCFKSCCKSEIGKHRKNECTKDAKVLRYYSYDKKAKKIYLYVCTKCNYMQLHKVHVVEHLQNEHGCSLVSETDVKQLLLVQLFDDLPQNIDIVNEPMAIPPPDSVEIRYKTDTGEQNITKTASNEPNPDISDASIHVKPEMFSIDSHLDQSTAANKQTVPFVRSSEGENIMAFTVIPCSNLNKNKHSEHNMPDIEELIRTWSSTPKESDESLIVAKPKHNSRTESSKPNTSSSATVEVTEEQNSNTPRDDITVEEQEFSQEVETNNICNNDIEFVENDEELKFDIPKVTTSPGQQISNAPLRVDNFGYQETRESEYVFHCFIDDCDYGATVSFQFLKDHVNAEHDIKWAGRCNICKDDLPASTGFQPISEELNHMLEVHVKEFQENYDHASTLLKPWLNTTRSQKTKILCEAMLTVTSLCSLYKCMGDDCDYTTDSKAQMSKHLATHELKIFGTAENKRPWLECCYCERYADKTLQILEHVERMHSTSIYQCSRCFYRSCASSNITVHQDQYHSSNVEENITLECSGDPKTITNEANRLNQLRADNVKAVSCSVCATKQYYRKDLMLNHLLEAHKERGIPKDCGMGLFSCIFCDLENDELDQIRLHMTNKHPEELPYIGVRRNNDKRSTADVTSMEFIGLSEKDSATDTAQLIEVQPQQDPSSSADQVLVMSETAITTYSENRIIETNDAVQKFKFPPVADAGADSIKQGEEKVTELNDRVGFSLCTKLMESLKCFLKSEISHPCYICFEKVNLENQWHNHFSAAHPSESPHVKRKCPLCSILCTFWAYPMHFVNHHKSPRTVYFCYFCCEDFNDVTAATMHVESHLIEEKVELTNVNMSQQDTAVKGDEIEYSIILPKHAHTYIDVVKHMLDVSERRKAREALIVSTPANMDDVTINLNDNVWATNCPIYVPPEKRFICTLCSNSTWLNEKSFEDHLRTQHSTATTFECSHCGINLINLKSYQPILDHNRQHSEQVYLCWLCKMYTSNKASLMNHINNYNRECVPVVFFSRSPDVMQNEYNVKVIHRSPISENISSGNNMKCLFCHTFVDTYKNLDEHLFNAHAIERFYRCHYCTYHGDEGNVDSHILNHHIKTQPNVSFRSATVYKKALTSYAIAQKCGSTGNAPCKDVQRISKKRKSNDVDQPKSIPVSEKKTKMESFAVELDRQDEANIGKNSDPSANVATNYTSLNCDYCPFTCFKIEEIVSHLKTAHREIVEAASNVDSSINSQTATTLKNLEPTAVTSTTFTPSELDKPSTVSLRVVPLSKLTNPIPSDQRNVLHPFTSQNLRNFPHSSTLQRLLQTVPRPSTSQGLQNISHPSTSQDLQNISRTYTSPNLQNIAYPATSEGLQYASHPSKSQGLQNISHPSTSQDLQNISRTYTSPNLQNIAYPATSEGLQYASHPSKSQGLQNISHPSTSQDLQNISRTYTSPNLQNIAYPATSEGLQYVSHPSKSQGLESISRPPTSQGLQNISYPATPQGLQNVPQPSISQGLQNVSRSSVSEGFPNALYSAASEGLQNISYPATSPGHQNALQSSRSQELQTLSRPSTSEGLQNASYPAISPGLQNALQSSTSQGLQKVSRPSTSQGLQNASYPAISQGLQNVSRSSVSEGFPNALYSAASQGLQNISYPATSQGYQNVPHPSISQGFQNVSRPSVSQGLQNALYPTTSQGTQNISYPGTSQGFQNVPQPYISQRLQNVSRPSASQGLQNALYPTTSQGIQNISYPATSQGFQNVPQPYISQQLQNISCPSVSQGLQNTLYPATSQGLQNVPRPSTSQEFQNFLHPYTSQGLLQNVPHQALSQNFQQSSTLQSPQRAQITFSREAAIKDLTYICFHCLTPFETKILLNRHWKNDSTCNAKKHSSFRYRIAQSPISETRLEKLIKTTKVKSMCYQCTTEQCNHIYLDDESFTNHLIRSNSLPKNSRTYSQEVILYGCNECRVFYMNEEFAIKHMARHTYRYSCVICHSVYRSTNELYAHYVQTHGSNEQSGRYVVRRMQNMQIYEEMLVVFPCGLVITMNDLCKTSWRIMDMYKKLIDRLISQDTT